MNIPKDFIDALPNMDITSIEAENFKVKGSIQLELSDFTEIVGDNGSGKTTLLDMVAFCFTGKSCFGENLDFINGGSDYTRVSLWLTDGLNNWELKRIIKTTPSGRQSTTITLNSAKLKQKEISEVLKEELVLSIINPVFFQSLTPTKARDFLAIVMNVNLETTILKNRSKIAITQKEKDIFDELFSKISNVEELKKKEKELKDHVKKMEDEKESSIYEVDVLQCAAVDEKEKVSSIIEELGLLTSIDDDSRKTLTDVIESVFDPSERQFEIDKKEEALKDLSIKIALESKQLEFIKAIYKKYLIEIESLTNSILTNTGVQLIEIKMKENEITHIEEEVEKEVFNIFYNALPIKNCSQAEKIKASIEIADALGNQTNVCLPTFIDNAESITSFKSPSFLNQLVSLTVLKGAKLSLVDGENVVDLKTKESMPKSKNFYPPIRRVLSTLF